MVTVRGDGRCRGTRRPSTPTKLPERLGASQGGSRGRTSYVPTLSHARNAVRANWVYPLVGTPMGAGGVICPASRTKNRKAHPPWATHRQWIGAPVSCHPIACIVPGDPPGDTLCARPGEDQTMAYTGAGVRGDLGRLQKRREEQEFPRMHVPRVHQSSLVFCGVGCSRRDPGPGVHVGKGWGGRCDDEAKYSRR